MRALDRKLETLRRTVRSIGPAAVAFSGGVDSTLVARVLQDEWGARALAVTLSSPLYPASELAGARRVAKAIGIEHRVITVDPMDDDRFAANAPDRCYVCKRMVFGAVADAARERGLDCVVDGSNADDATDYRPGTKARDELGVRSPLAESGFTKADVRAASKVLRLPTSGKRASPCLASRVPYGEAVTREKMRMIELAEGYLARLGFEDVRVRAHGGIARIEVSPGQVSRLASDEVRSKVARRLRTIGFAYVTIDAEGYRMGSLNEVLRK